MQMTGELGSVLSQKGEIRRRRDRVQESGDELAQQAPYAGPGQAAIAQRGETSNASVSGSSNRMASRCARM